MNLKTDATPPDAASSAEGMFEAGNVPLQSGRTFRNMRLAYKTFGTLNADRTNVSSTRPPMARSITTSSSW
jgi:homoserine acetyltransferase